MAVSNNDEPAKEKSLPSTNERDKNRTEMRVSKEREVDIVGKLAETMRE